MAKVQKLLIENCWKVLNKAQKLSVELPWGYVRGIQLGPKTGKTVVMIHGWLDNCHSYLPLLTHLPHDNTRYIVLDLPGHGISTHKPKTSYVHVIDYVVDMERIRRELKLEKFSLIGHSLGGILSGMYTAAYPDKVERCVAIDGLLPFYLPNDYIVSNIRKAVDTIVDDTFKHKYYDDLATLNDRLSKHYGIDSEIAKLLLERSARLTPNGYQFTYDKRLRYPALLRMTKDVILPLTQLWERPILFILASNGFKVLNHPSYLEGIKVLSSHPNITQIEIEGNHHVHIQNPVGISEAVTEFLALDEKPDPVTKAPYNFKGL